MLDITSVIHRDPDIFSGQTVFVGTRVPFQIMLDYLESGETLDEFLEDFPSVSREQAVSALRLPEQMLTQNAHLV